MTAIDKILEEMIKYRDTCCEEYKFPYKVCVGALERAKKLEKEEIIKAWNDGNFHGRNGNMIADYNTGEQYYNETYGQEREYLKESTCEYSGLRSVQSYEDPKK